MKYYAYNLHTSEYCGSKDAENYLMLPQIDHRIRWTDVSLPDKKPAEDECYLFSLVHKKWYIDKAQRCDAEFDDISAPTCAKINPTPVLTKGKNGLFLIDDILLNPEEVRAEALSNQFYQRSSFSGTKTKNYDITEIVKKVAELIDVPLVPTPKSHCAYKINGANDRDCRNGIHGDPQSGRFGYAGILYLNLPHECKGGTSLYRHKETGVTSRLQTDHDHKLSLKHWIDGRFPDRWEEIDRVEMKYNRLGIYPCNNYHDVTEFFDGRLVMTLFMSNSLEKR